MSERITETKNEQDSMKTTQVAHLAGVFDGAGEIALRVEKAGDYNLGYRIIPVLRFTVHSEDDPSLGKLIEYSEEHDVNFSLLDQKQKVQWTVTDPDSIERFLESIDRHLLSNMFRAKLMLDVVLPAIRNGDHLNKDGFYELVGIAEKMREGRSKNAKYTQEYFDEEWSLAK